MLRRQTGGSCPSSTQSIHLPEAEELPRLGTSPEAKSWKRGPDYETVEMSAGSLPRVPTPADPLPGKSTRRAPRTRRAVATAPPARQAKEAMSHPSLPERKKARRA
eukprot:5802371-Pyramimonas_sp.AAC.1